MVGKELGEIVPFFVLGFVSSLAIHYFIISDLQLFFSIIQYIFFVSLLPLFILLGYVVSWRWRKQQAGYLLLTLGKTGSRKLLLLASLIQVIIATCFIAMTLVCWLENLSASYYQLLFQLSPAIFFVLLTILCLLVSQSRLELRERGICPGFCTIKWEQVAGYQWEGKKKRLLRVYFQASFPFVKNWTWRINDKHREAVEIIVSEFTSFYQQKS
ncbi:MAG: hypothetical protein SAJ37_12230 [Oscillatoria sp. PMC 1068.18]|nr:hypothetical protein [Oscillatoria sp. PMC 1068.18]